MKFFINLFKNYFLKTSKSIGRFLKLGSDNRLRHYENRFSRILGWDMVGWKMPKETSSWLKSWETPQMWRSEHLPAWVNELGLPVQIPFLPCEYQWKIKYIIFYMKMIYILPSILISSSNYAQIIFMLNLNVIIQLRFTRFVITEWAVFGLCK